MVKEKTLNEICSEPLKRCPLCGLRNLRDMSLTMFYGFYECLDCGCQWSKFGDNDWEIRRKFNTMEEWEEHKKTVGKNFRGDKY